MSLLRTMLRQWAVYWPPAGVDEFGNYHHGEPVELRAHWRRDLSASIGTNEVTRSSDAKVVVASPVAVGGRLWEGRLVDLDGDGVHEDAMEIEAVAIGNRVKGAGSVYEVAVT